MSKERIKIYLKNKPKNLLDFLSKFFLMKNNWTTSVETYFDEECTKIQCKSETIRSFDDLYACCLTYFPKTKPEKLFSKLLTTYYVIDGNKARIFLYSCHTIKRTTLYYMNSIRSYHNICETKKFYSEYSWKELFNMLGINSQKDLDEYLKTHKQYEIK